MPAHDERRSRKASFAYLLQVFPKYSETFIVNELLGHQEAGQPVRVLSLRLPREGRFHGCVAELAEAAEYVAESYWDQPDKRREALRSVARESPAGLLRALALLARRRVTFRDVWQAALVRRWAARRGVSHLHCHFGGFAATTAYLSRLMNGPSYSVTLHAHEIFRDTADHALLRDVVGASAFCVTVSNFNARHLCEQIKAPSDKIRVLYNGIALDRFPRREGPRDPGTILSVGRLIEKKGFVHLIRACKPLAERGLLTRCDIVGEGREKDALAAEIKRLGLSDKVRLAGPWSQARVADALGRYGVFALPCVRAADGNMDALPTVLLEAMASGCPVVSTTLSGIPEIIANGQTGLLVPPGDECALADAIAATIIDADRSRRFAAAGRARAEERFDVRRSVAVLASWLGQAAEASMLERARTASPKASAEGAALAGIVPSLAEPGAAEGAA